MEAYLARRGDPKVRSLFDVMLFNVQNRERELRAFGHEWFVNSQVTLGMTAGCSGAAGAVWLSEPGFVSAIPSDAPPCSPYCWPGGVLRTS